MKALILAAGLGTRLLPFTKHTPKPLFTIAGQPLIDIIIKRLEYFNCKSIIINTHHLHHKIEDFIQSQDYTIPVHTRYEPVILGTGGAIKNAEDFFGKAPFLIINSDIITNINLKNVYEFHLSHNFPVTLVLCDHPEFNNVSINKNDFIIGFHHKIMEKCSKSFKKLSFTGIHIIDPEVLDFIQPNKFSSIIDIYLNIMTKGKKIKAFVINQQCFKDIGTPASYKDAAMKIMAEKTFNKIFPNESNKNIIKTELQSDGSDKKWYRFCCKNRSLVMGDNGIKDKCINSEIDSFVLIGNHLHRKGIPVPEIYNYDIFSGLVIMEDLGEINLQTYIANAESSSIILSSYKNIIDNIIKMNISGRRDFQTSWTCQTPYYDTELILEKECRYFVDAFLRTYLNLEVVYNDFVSEFQLIAEKALQYSISGFMHRDMQSRNIMVKNKKFYFIDFQGGRLGPLQYDLASLLIDPYVNLPRKIQNELVEYIIEKLTHSITFNKKKFHTCYKYCLIARNLQILGAFAYLSRIKRKTWFEQYIPAAVKTLKYNLNIISEYDFIMLKSILAKI